jgi:hypothetical protein
MTNYRSPRPPQGALPYRVRRYTKAGESVWREVRQHLPEVQKFAQSQAEKLPKVEELRDAHHHKVGKIIVRGMIALAGALVLLDLALASRL